MIVFLELQVPSIVVFQPRSNEYLGRNYLPFLKRDRNRQFSVRISGLTIDFQVSDRDERFPQYRANILWHSVAKGSNSVRISH